MNLQRERRILSFRLENFMLFTSSLKDGGLLLSIEVRWATKDFSTASFAILVFFLSFEPSFNATESSIEACSSITKGSFDST